jgi:CRISPR-associated protein Csm5
MDIEITVQSPVHVGIEEERLRQEYVFDGGRAHKPNLDRYFRNNPDEIEAFVADIEDGRPMADFFDEGHQYGSYAAETWVSEDAIGGSPIQPFVKTRGEEPYLPGSSLKGAIRTALACEAIRQGATVSEYTESSVEGLFTLQQVDPDGFADPQRDVMRCLTIRDATPALGTELPLALCEVKTYSLKRGGEMKPEHWSKYVECLRPETTLTSELHVDVDELVAMVDEFGHSSTVDAIFGETRSEAAILDRIQTALQNLGKAIMRQDRELISELDEIESFYDGLADGDSPLLRVGFGTGWHSNTIGTALPQGEVLAIRAGNSRLGKPTLHEEDDCGGKLVGDDHNPGQLFCIECETVDIDPQSDAASSTPFPKTRRFIHRRGTPAYPLGWTTLSAKS